MTATALLDESGQVYAIATTERAGRAQRHEPRALRADPGRRHPGLAPAGRSGGWTAAAERIPRASTTARPKPLRQALHELQVHQIELEMQNDELRRMQVELDAERARYFDLYDLAPVGYCTISEQGLILEANFTAPTCSGWRAANWSGEPLSRFIVRADQDTLLPVSQAPGGDRRAAGVRAAHDARGRRAVLGPYARGGSARCEGSTGVPPGAGRRFRAQEAGAALQDKNVELERARQVADQGQPGQVGLPCRHEP